MKTKGAIKKRKHLHLSETCVYWDVSYYFMTPSEKIELLNTVLIVIGGLWIAYNFLLKRERFPKVEFCLDLRLIERTSNRLILEFIASLENKGIARHYIDLKTFILKIRFLTESDLSSLTNHTVLPFKDKDGNRTKIDFFSLNFPHSVKPEFGENKEIFWMPKEWDYIFIDGGTKQKISLPLSIPSEAKYILVKSEFKYKDPKSGLHSAQSVFNVNFLKNNS